jgi:aldehyde dehydrogenase (NAD+)
MTSLNSLGTRLLIDGELVTDVDFTVDVINPSTGEVARTVPLGGIGEVDCAIAAARRAFRRRRVAFPAGRSARRNHDAAW